MSVIGHCFPIQYVISLFRFKFDLAQAKKYRGGKGVSTTGGVLFAISPWLGLIAFGI
jgi:glycerol-3-phosphate acyltransferase PlsY